MAPAHRYKWKSPPNESGFRFLDLPRELRDQIYEFCLVEPFYKPYWMQKRKDEVTKETRHRLIQQPLVALAIDVDEPTVMLKEPSLLSVSRQIRAEADPTYWSKNSFVIQIDVKHHVCIGRNRYNGSPWNREEVDDDLATPMRQFQRWVDIVGMNRLRHLRRLKLCVDLTCLPYRFSYTTHQRGRFAFRARLGKQKDLRVRLPEQRWSCMKFRSVEMRRHFIACEMKQEKNGWLGESIIDFFVGNKNFWSTWFFSYPNDDEWRRWEDPDGPGWTEVFNVGDEDSAGGVALEDGVADRTMESGGDMHDG